MASLRTLPGTKNFIACLTDSAGRRLQRFTGTHVRTAAAKIAEEYEEAAHKLKTEAHFRNVLSDLYERVVGAPLPSGTMHSFFLGRADRKAVESANSTATKYRATVKLFLAHLGSRADLDLGCLTPADVLGFRAAVSKRLSALSVNLNIKLVRVALNSARRAGLISTNPATQVENLKRKGEGSIRRAFSLEELRCILDVADEEWRGLIALGLYTGQRLGDLARLTWANLDLTREEIRFVTKKTGRQVILPLVRPLDRLHGNLASCL